MLGRLIDLIPLSIIGAMVSPKRKLNAKELVAQSAFIAKLDIKERKIAEPLIIALIGLIGSGKSSVARELAEQIGATIIENDAIRLELRKQGASYDRAWAIAENVAVEVVKRGGSVILDSDFAEAKKRASVREKAKKAGVRFLFIRTFCEFDVVSERIRNSEPKEFFANAKSSSASSDKGKDVKFRELWRRTPHHYTWVNQGGGKWVPKRFSFVSAEFNTANPDMWKKQVRSFAEKLLK